jgi:hypothetical protein
MTSIPDSCCTDQLPAVTHRCKPASADLRVIRGRLELRYGGRRSSGRKRAIGAVVARFVHTEEVTGSNPVSPTSIIPSQTPIPAQPLTVRAGYVQD